MSESNGIIERRPAITPSDDAAVKISATDGIRVNTSGIVRMTDPRGNTEDTYLLGGVDYPYAVVKVYLTGTTATGIAALYYA